MKRGCYLVDDQRVQSVSEQGTAAPRLTRLVRAEPSFIEVTQDEDGVQKLERSYLTRVFFWNLYGWGHCVEDVDLEHPDFVDDEEKGLVTIGSSDGPIHLRWPTQADYDSLAGGLEGMEPFPDVSSDEERQAFLSTLIGVS